MSDAKYPWVNSMDTDIGSADAPWNTFSSHDYWRSNYSHIHAEDREIISRVSHFLTSAFADRAPARWAIDVGSGTNLYPALLMLPWAERILLADYSESNIGWLRQQIARDGGPWAWRTFWQEMQAAKGYRDVAGPRERLREACAGEPGYAGIERWSIFDLPEGRWDVGTMFFVAESITRRPGEFLAALEHFVDALKPDSPLAAAFLAGSHGYEVAGTTFPAIPITCERVERNLTELGVRELTVELLDTRPGVRDGYEGIVVATGFASSRRQGRGS
jgi:NNMT/PNMT/TEMT family